MKKAVVLFISLLFFSIPTCLSQQAGNENTGQRIDSLQNALKTAGDSLRVDLLNSLCRLYIGNKQAERAMVPALQAQKLSEMLAYKKGMAGVYNVLGLIEYNKSHYKQAIHYFSKSIELSESSGFRELSRLSYNISGNLFQDIGNYKKALEFYLLALRIAEETGNKEDEAYLYNNLGNVYAAIHSYDKAIENYGRSMKIMTELGDKNGMALYYINQGTIYYDQEKDELAKQSYLKALELSRQTGNVTATSDALNNLGLIYYYAGDYKKANESYSSALKIRQQAGNMKGVASCFCHLGQIAMMTKNYKQAESFLNQGLKIAETVGSKPGLSQIYLTFYELNEKEKNHEAALKYYVKYTQIKDSLFNIENAENITRTQALYENETRESENKRLLMENRMSSKIINQQKTIFYVGFIALVLCVILIVYILRWYKLKDINNQLKVKSQEMALDKLNEMKTLADLKTLQASINPHFLYNSLNSIISLIHERPKEAEEMIIKLSNLFRYSINSMEANWATVNEELKIVKNYIDIEQIRFGDRITFTTRSEETVLNLFIPRFLLQPLVENAIKHGLRDKIAGGLLEINIKDKQENIEIEVCDNGIPFPVHLIPGYGLQSIHDKLNLLYHNDWKMTVSNVPDKKIALLIPKTYKNERAIQNPDN